MHKYKYVSTFLLTSFLHIQQLSSGCLENQLIKFVLQKNESKVEQCLSSHVKFDFDHLDEQGKTVLIHAIQNNLIKTIKLLLSYKVNIDQTDDDGRSALLWATIQDNTEIVSLLLSNNANPNIADNDKLTPLIAASTTNNVEIIKLLLKHGADPEVQDINNNNALLLATALGHKEIVEILLDKNVKLETKNIYGNTALMLSVINLNQYIVEILLYAGANPLTKNNMGETPLKKATEIKNLNILSLIYDSIAENYFYGENVIIDYNATRIFYEKILEFKLESLPIVKTKANYYLGIIYHNGHGVKSDLDKSLKHFQKVNPEFINSNEILAAFNLYMGLIYSNRLSPIANDDIAHNYLLKAATMYLNNDEMSKKYLALSLIQQRKKNFKEAIVNLKIVIEQSSDPDTIALGFLNLGDIHVILKNYQTAIFNYKEVLKLKDLIKRRIKSIANFKLGKIHYLAKGDFFSYDLALSHFQDVDDNDLDANGVILKNYFVGYIYFISKKYDQAIDHLHIASNQEINKLFSVVSKFTLAKCFYKTNNIKQAFNYAKKVAQNNIDEATKANGILLLGKIYLDLKRYEEAIRCFNAVIKQNPNKYIISVAHFFLAKMHFDGFNGQNNYEIASNHLNAIAIESIDVNYRLEVNKMIDVIKSRNAETTSKQHTELSQSHQ